MAAMSEPHAESVPRRFPLWRLFWWVTFFALVFGVMKAHGAWALIQCVALVLLCLSQAWVTSDRD